MEKVLIFTICITVLMMGFGMGADALANPKVTMETSEGKIVIELYPDKAPKTVANFLAYAENNRYDGTIFHRVIPGFMIQGGGFTANMKQKATLDSIENEADNGLKNEKGTIAMARTQDPHSATAQFFINAVDNDFLNFRSKDVRGWGYTVFGRVVEGMDVVEKIEKVKTHNVGMFADVPEQAIEIQSTTVDKEGK